MSAYRENAIPSSETLHDFPVSTRRGHALVVTLGVIAMFLLVAAAVTIFAGAPPAIEGWKWPMTAAGALALVGAIVLHQLRRRRLLIVRTGDVLHLIVEREEVRLAFPLAISGDQMTTRVNGIPMYEVWLKLVDASHQRGIFLGETRGAIHGAQEDWLTGIDKTVACDRFEVGRVGLLAELRAAVESINARRR